MSTVYRVRGIHITAESGPPYSLGLFGHRNNPFLGSFEKATQLCRLINCKSWPTRKVLHEVASKSVLITRKPCCSVSLNTDRRPRTQDTFEANALTCYILKLQHAALLPPDPIPTFVLCTLCMFPYFVSFSFSDKKAVKPLRTSVFQVVMENI